MQANRYTWSDLVDYGEDLGEWTSEGLERVVLLVTGAPPSEDTPRRELELLINLNLANERLARANDEIERLRGQMCDNTRVMLGEILHQAKVDLPGGSIPYLQYYSVSEVPGGYENSGTMYLPISWENNSAPMALYLDVCGTVRALNP